MPYEKITKEQYDSIAASKECPCCGAGEHLLMTHPQSGYSLFCSWCHYRVYPIIPGNSRKLHSVPKFEFVKTREEALAYLDENPNNILAYTLDGFFISKKDIDQNVPLYRLIEPNCRIENRAFRKPYVLWKSKHLKSLDEIDNNHVESVVCPYCGLEDEHVELGEDNEDTIKCTVCRREYDVTVKTTKQYTTTRRTGEAEKKP